STNYSDDEKFSVTNLVVPEPDTLQLFNQEFERQGVKFKILCLAGAGTLSITNGTNFGIIPNRPGSSVSWSSEGNGRNSVETWASMKPFFLIESSLPDPQDDIRFRLIGSDGKDIPLESSGWYGRSGGGRKYQQRFDATNDVSSISLEVIVSRARPVEFVIDPAEVRRLNATKK